MKNLREFLQALEGRGDVISIDAEVDPHLELSEIHRRVISENGKVLFFKRVKGSPFPVVTNLFGNLSRIELAFGEAPEKFVRDAVGLLHDALPPQWGSLWERRSLLGQALKVGLQKRTSGPVVQNEVPLVPGQGLDLLPALVQWPEDGGRFVTLPLVYTEHPTTKKHNLGMYRIHIYDHATTGMHWQIHKGGGFHYSVAEGLDQEFPVTLHVGGPPALMLSAIAPLPEDIPELMLASLLMGQKLPRVHSERLPHPIVAECEFAFVGKVKPHVRRPEGPFGDHYGYYSLQHDYPVFEVQRMFHRDSPIWPATVVGKPRQEDFYIGDYLQKLLSPLFPLVMPGVVSLKTYGETGFHALAAAQVKCRYAREAIASGLRILGEGQLSLQKFLMLTDGPVDLDDFPKLLQHFLERTNWQTDLFVLSNISQDTLDYTGPRVNEGSKGLWLALGKEPLRRLNAEMPATFPSSVRKAGYFVPGCLVVEGPTWSSHKSFASDLAQWDDLKDVPLILVVDSLQETLSSTEKFLWTWFTRFEPAADIHARAQALQRFHVSLEPPIVFDCRMKPWYPGTVEPDPKTVSLVNARWGEYFPNGGWR